MKRLKINLKTNNFFVLILFVFLALSSRASGEDYKLLKPSLIISQEKITGKVTSNGLPVASATVKIKGNESVATSTNESGDFSINAKVGETIIVEILGYEAQEKLISGNVMDFDIAQIDESIDEVVVTGYSTQKRGNISASIASVSQKELMDTKSPNVSNLLQGKVSGVDVVTGSGQPGKQGNIRIRGRNSISSGTDPLWVVDGIIAHGTPNINPNDIETISVLKDAAATSQYGSRGTNGVVVVTTKRAASGEGIFSANISTGFGYFNSGHFKLMDSQQLWDTYQSFNNVSAIPNNITESVLDNNFNWVENGTQVANLQDHNVSYMGKTEKTSIYASGNYYKEDGTVKGFTYDRMTARLNLEHKLTNKLTFSPKINVSYTQNDNRQHSLYDMYLNMPWDNPYNSDGTLKNPQAGGVVWYGRDNNNYLYDLQYNYGNEQIFDIQSNMDFSYKLNNLFTLESMNSLSYFNSNNMSYTDPKSNAGLGNQGSVYQFADKRIVRFFNQMLKYNQKFDKHEVSGFIAYEYSDYKYSSLNGTGKGITPGSQTVGNAAEPQALDGVINDYAFQSGILQATYSYANKYNLQGSFRVDGSSRFGSENRYGSFYAISGAWNIHNEDFFTADFINQLRLKASFGTVGNVPNSYYASYALYSLDGQYNGEPAAYPDQYQNSLVGWEKSKDTNLGLELSLLNRFNFTFDWYYKNTDGLLYYVAFPSTAGWEGYWQNIGAIRNKGVELSINADLLRAESPFKWSLGFNIAKNNNRINELKDGLDIPAGNKRYSEGRDIDSWYMREWAGVDASNGAPLWEVVDAETGEVSTTSNYNSATLQFVGTATPKYQGGFSTFMSYKSFSLNASFAYLNGAMVYNSGRELFDSDGAYPSYNQMILKDDWSRWSSTNTNATHPVAAYNNNSNSNKTSSRYLEDASYLKLRNVTLTYNFKPELIEKIKLRGASIYVAGDNLWTSTKYSGEDPEAALYPATVSPSNEDAGDATAQYPAPRRVTFGINVSF